jgi:hypothetical protein
MSLFLSCSPHTCGVSGVTGSRPADEKQSAAELDLVLQRHQDLQEKLAEEMLGLARSLKTNTLAAQSVIKKDNQVGGLWDFSSLCLRVSKEASQDGALCLGLGWMSRSLLF